jgi:hypothetical protein
VRVAGRFAFLKAVARTGLPVHVCGAGWERDLYRFKRVTYEGEVPEDAFAIARAVLAEHTWDNRVDQLIEISG